jgi:hypothetical protein
MTDAPTPLPPLLLLLALLTPPPILFLSYKIPTVAVSQTNDFMSK